MAQNLNKAGQTHDQLQAACWLWACQTYHPWVHGRLIAIPNDMHAGNVARWKQYEALGVTPGVWDMQLFWFQVKIDVAAGIWSKDYVPAIFWWEFKVGNDKLKPKQKLFREKMIPIGHTFFIASEEEEFQKQFNNVVEPTMEYVKEIFI